MKTLKTLLIILGIGIISAASISKQPVIIDTDVAIDDAIAILYLLNRPDIEVKAITIATSGVANCADAFHHVTGMLRMMGQENIPVACGRSTMHALKEEDTLAGTETLLPTSKKPVMKNAVSLFINTIIHSNQPVTILAIGPLTNIAEAIKQNPDIIKKIRRIYIMGGAITVPGNIALTEETTNNHVAEWNIYVDPYAASIVFSSAKLPISLIPLDVTNTMPIDWDFYQKLKRDRHTLSANFVYALFQRNEKLLREKRWSFWDPLAAAILSDQSFATWKNLPLVVELAPSSHAGALVINNKNGKEVRVYEQADKKYFENLLLKTFSQV